MADKAEQDTTSPIVQVRDMEQPPPAGYSVEDSKYGTIIVEKLPGQAFASDEPVILFRAKDVHMPAVLDAYEKLCKRDGSPPEHMDSIKSLRDETEAWQKANSTLVKLPD